MSEEPTTPPGKDHTVNGLALVADPEQGWIDDVIDIDRYPIHEPHRPAWRELVHEVTRRLATEGACELTGFLRPEARAEISRQLGAARTHVPIREHESTVYARADLEATLPADDPRCTALRWHAGHVTRDMIPAYAPSHRLYAAPRFKAFVAACVGRNRVFEYADPMAGLIATILPPGGRYPWHYDTNEFVVTVMIDRAEVGGVFEYCPNLRRPGDENLAGLGRILAGDDHHLIRRSDVEPGTLQVFLGRHSLHRVTQVEGTSTRVMLVLSYADRPGVIGPVDRTRSVYGRVTEAHLVAGEQRSRAADGLIL
ncbi:MAG: hypothetical protein AAF467_21805 [Actinomycetota bacterium]